MRKPMKLAALLLAACLACLGLTGLPRGQGACRLLHAGFL